MKADIWSLGVVFYEMLFGVCPFTAKNIAFLIKSLDQNQMEIPKKIPISEKTSNILKLMLIKDPEKRISWERLFSLFFIEEEPKRLCKIILT